MLNANKNWRDYPELVELDNLNTEREFYNYTRVLKVDGCPPELGWLGKKVAHTIWRYYYTGGTFCIIQDNCGNNFIGTAICSHKDMFCREAGRTVSKYYALNAMQRAYEICGSTEVLVVLDLVEVTVPISEDLEVTGMALGSGVE